MYLDKAKKEEIFGQYGKNAQDTGSAEAQIALFSYRISHLTEHLKKNHKDHNTARSLTMLVGKRRKLLNKALLTASLFLFSAMLPCRWSQNTFESCTRRPFCLQRLPPIRASSID